MRNYTITLIGVPSSGKTTLFNAVTGRNQAKVPWPNSEFLLSKGKFPHGEVIYHFYDLPGVQSLSGTSPLEGLINQWVTEHASNLFLFVCNAACLEQEFPLLLTLMTHTPNIIVCLNKVDLLRRTPLSIDTDVLSKQLSLPVIRLSAKKQNGLYQLLCSIDDWTEQPATAEMPLSNFTSPSKQATELFRSCSTTFSNLFAKWRYQHGK